MHATAELLSVIAERLGAAILHSLWQGALVAVLLGLTLGALRQRSAAARHGACLLALLAMLASAVVTAWRMPVAAARPAHSPTTMPMPVEAIGASPAPAAPVSEAESPTADSTPVARGAEAPSPRAWRAGLRPMTPMIAALWIIGVLALSVRHAAAWRQVRAWRRKAAAPDGPMQRAFAQLAARFGLARARLLVCAEAATPMLVGVVKPAVLLPVRVLTGLSAAELEAILAHELAHLARRDAWSNTAQVAIETLLFYHPAVWWIGRRAREERENAADDLALSICTDRRTYAGALAQLAALQAGPALALAATGGSLLARIRRIVQPVPQETPASQWGIGVPALLGAVALAAVFAAQAQEARAIEVRVGESIQAAIDSAPPGAIVRLGAGEWRERLVIAKPLTLEGAGWERTRITIEEPPAEELKGRWTQLQSPLDAAATPEELEKATTAWVQGLARPAVWVRGATAVKLQRLRIQGVSQRGREDGGTVSTLVYFQRAAATMSECAVIGPFGRGVFIAGESEVEIRNSLVAAIWNNGITVAGKGRVGQASRLRLSESEVRNVYHYGVAIGRGCDTTMVERCRISGTAWHGIRYDDASPTITGNTLSGHARFGIYASGKTRATVRGNLFWKNEMSGMSCWFDCADRVEGNTFVGNLREGLLAVGGAKPEAVRNIFANHPVAVTGNAASNGPTAVGAPVLTENLFSENQADFRVSGADQPLPEGNRRGNPAFRNVSAADFALAADSPARAAGLGVADPLTPGGAWPLLAEETAIIPGDDTREFSYWSAAGGAKPSKRTADLAIKAQTAAKDWIADAFQLDDESKRLAAIESIRAALAGSDLGEVRKALSAFTRIAKVEFDKPSFRPALRALLRSPQADLRAQACTALSVCGPSAEDVELLVALVDDSSADVRVALPYALKPLSNHDFTGATGAAILRLLDRKEGPVTKAVWHACWGTKISPEIEARVVAASRADANASGYSEVFYHALTPHLSKREPSVTRLIELLASPDITNVAGRVLWGLLQGVAADQEPRVADAALKVLAARSDDYLRRQALQCVRAYGKPAHLEPLRTLLAKPGVAGDFRKQLESTLQAIEARPAP